MRPFLLSLLLLAGCEMGTDPQGPNIATLSLRSDNGVVRDFYLGGYDSADQCQRIVSEETAAANDRSNEFWTNPDFTYGGVKKEGWDRNTVVGGKCSQRH